MEPHDEIENVLQPDALLWAMEPLGPPLGEAACSSWDSRRFPTPQEQQAAFDGEPTVPERGIPQARAMCRTCPLLESCRRYAQDSRDEHAFLAGATVDERRKKWRKTGEIAKRRRRVAELHALHVPTATIAQLLQCGESSIRSDLRKLGKGRSHLPPTA
ncbi:WhiB family transcriptional regulator [Streptomyces pinistramenti]|uniref:WhiB family transcriptional regulator n=1 Tax=Streptomyces pinistramenti TaxID=2884812 RepID=UPI001D05DCB1|nr:WhiB family transcriptional regulator [Streptomyces pinistramenti]MCB5910912.1 WhiB family transcriptional regulator [Streptomyces pinistramenti]